MNHVVDKLNILLIILSGILAYHFPLELFIISYSILGPLHYITEINWLNDKNYFLNEKKWIWLALGVMASLILFIPKIFSEYGNIDSWIGKFMLHINYWSNAAIFLCLLLAIGSQFIKSKVGWGLLFITGVVISILLNKYIGYNHIIGLFIPTIIHVYIFTLIFMLYGAKISKSKFGYIAVILAILVPIMFIFVTLDETSYLFGKIFKEIYIQNNFHVVPVVFSKYLGLSDGKTFFFYENLELKLMMFMSFIYLYHYLNWFSKTAVIKWHKQLDLKKSIVIVLLWVTCLLMYYLDFRLGLLFSLFLSFLHVILEFPLNIISIRGLFKS